MRTFKRAWLVPVAMLALLTAACASAPSGGTAEVAGVDAPPEATVFTIQNTHSSGRDMAIFLDPQGRGERVRIGIVPAGRTETFTHTVDRGRYVLIAAHNLGEVESDQMNLSAPSTVSWDLGTDRMIVRRR